MLCDAFIYNHFLVLSFEVEMLSYMETKGDRQSDWKGVRGGEGLRHIEWMDDGRLTTMSVWKGAGENKL